MRTKLLYLIFLSVFVAVSGYAQITYSSTDYASAKDSFLITSGTAPNMAAYNFDTTGANITWNYATLPMSTQRMVQYEGNSYPLYKSTFVASCVSACIGGGGGTVPCTNSCNATWSSNVNLSRPSIDSLSLNAIQVKDGVDLLEKGSSALSQKMVAYTMVVSGVSVPLVIEYNGTDDIYKFPLQYTNVDSSEYTYAIDLTTYGVPLKYNTYKKRKNQVEGWGELITPYKTYSSTLKLRTVIDRNDTITIDTIQLAQAVVKTVRYSWFAAGNKIPVLEASGQIINGVEVITNVMFLDTVRCLTPEALFAYSPVELYLSGSDSVQVDFKNLSLNASEFSWDFADAVSGSKNTSTIQNPVHIYKAPGTYLVNLIACSPSSCMPSQCDTITVPVVIFDSTKVNANFKFIPSYPCENDSVHFINTSINATSYNWDFDDGGTSILKNPSHKFTAGGIYNVRLIAKKTTQSDTVYKTIEVAGASAINAGNDVTINKGDSTQLNVTGAGAHTTYVWHAKSGLSCYNCPDPIASPKATTVFVVTAYDFCGTSTDTVVVNVNSIPTGIFKDGSLQQVLVYPNPASEQVSISYEASNATTIKIYNMIGDLVYATSDNRNGTQMIHVNVGKFVSGVYFIQLQNGKGGNVKRFTVSH